MTSIEVWHAGFHVPETAISMTKGTANPPHPYNFRGSYHNAPIPVKPYLNRLNRESLRPGTARLAVERNRSGRTGTVRQSHFVDHLPLVVLFRCCTRSVLRFVTCARGSRFRGNATPVRDWGYRRGGGRNPSVWLCMVLLARSASLRKMVFPIPQPNPASRRGAGSAENT